MKNFLTYQVHPNIPENLAFLEVLSRNMWWCWKKDAIEVFRRIDPGLWVSSGRNPIAFLAKVPQSRFEQLTNDKGYLAHLDRVRGEFQRWVSEPVIDHQRPFNNEEKIAYFSMEFGLHESLPLFAGGLGILAGDHLKASSNLALPLLGIGLMYREGYFRQYLDQDGCQQEEYPQTNIYNLPVERIKDAAGNDLTISIQGPDEMIHAVVWKINVGRIPLFLLDANIAENSPATREITSRLYSGDSKVRLAQEMLLGIGGMKALAAMHTKVKVLHMNEGHSAFSSLQRLVQIMGDYEVDLSTALEIIPRTTVFTTHTPVAAGHDEFAVEMVKPYLKDLAQQLNVETDEILSWGQPEGSNADAPLSMFILALNMSAYCNGVSKLHGSVARRMWSFVWPQRPEEEVPISHVTNGIHVPTFVSQEFAYLFDRILGPEWHLSSRKPENIEHIDDIYDEELWRSHEMNRSRLVRTCREQLVKQYDRRNAPRQVLEAVESALDPDILTIAFARRFATYKRANLLLHDEKRLESIINNPNFPVQFIFAGKAHPSDDEGKELIKRLFQFAGRPEVRDKFVFLEDYDMHFARHLLQGADVWLNTPRRPFEACGTSGMKAAINGLLNVSILDGWWCEGYSPEVGWRIGNGEEYEDHSYQDAIESQALYNILENEVIPCFYDRKNGDLPACWLKKMKNAMKMAMESFCSLRMVADYEDRYYTPLAKRWDLLLANNAEEAKKLTAQINRFHTHWENIRIETPVRQSQEPYRVGDSFQVAAEINLTQLTPEDVDVELYYGNLQSLESLSSSHVEPMAVRQDLGNGKYLYDCTLKCEVSGRFGYTVRVSPRGDDRIKSKPRLMTWA